MIDKENFLKILVILFYFVVILLSGCTSLNDDCEIDYQKFNEPIHPAGMP